MNPFALLQADSVAEASAAAKDVRLSVLKAGGMDLLDLMKEGIAEPTQLVNLRTVRDPALRTIEAGRIGALATLADIARSDAVRASAPVIAKCAASAATPQVRNVATAGGNLLQRPRCWYFRNEQFNCLKKGGSTCYAVDGENRYHAVFGPGPCHIVHPSNLAVALLACDGVVSLAGGERATLPIAKLFHMPDRGIRDESNLEPGEVITSIAYSPAPVSGFFVVKERQSFDWPLTMAAVALKLDGRRIASARVCAGAVAPVPWSLPLVEKALQGVALDDEAALRAACAKSIDGAEPMRDNAYKLKLLPVAIRRAIADAAGAKEGQ
ncbi:MAG: FAD binding domain-containing protein [Phycisphaerales bacterium]|nr:FAD binding domain-containing protein [Phycisphaerales bacterium]